jgi:hypothetical protein
MLYLFSIIQYILYLFSTMQSMLLVDIFFHLRQQNVQNKLHDILLWNMQNIKKIAKHNLMQNPH